MGNREGSRRVRRGAWLINYIEVLKPRESVLHVFMGACAALVAWGWQGAFPTGTFLLAALAILLGISGANGITNYIDREYDARMERVKHRPIPSGRIDPPQKVLPLVIGLVVAGLIAAWFLHWLCFLFGALGIIAASTWRKRVTCAFPQGAMASCAPVLVGYLAITTALDWTIFVICILIIFWVPIHVWSLMIANREDYRQAGITFFPLSWEVRDTVKVLLGLSAALFASSIALYYYSQLETLYLAVACVLGILMVVATARLVFTNVSHDAWRVYKLTAFPYLGILFLAMILDVWLL